MSQSKLASLDSTMAQGVSAEQTEASSSGGIVEYVQTCIYEHAGALFSEVILIIIAGVLLRKKTTDRAMRRLRKMDDCRPGTDAMDPRGPSPLAMLLFRLASLNDVEAFDKCFTTLTPAIVSDMVRHCSTMTSAPNMISTVAWVEDLAASRGVRRTPRTYERLVAAYASGHDERGVQNMGAMVEFWYFPNEAYCRYAIARCLDSGSSALAMEIAQGVRGRSVLDLRTYKAILTVYATAGLFAESCNVYHDMMKAGVEPDCVTYESLLIWSSRAGRPLLAKTLLHKSRGQVCLKAILWTLRAASKAGDVKGTIEFFNKIGLGHRPGFDTLVYNNLLDDCVAAKDHVSAVSYFEDMARRGTRMNAWTCNIMVKLAPSPETLMH